MNYYEIFFIFLKFTAAVCLFFVLVYLVFFAKWQKITADLTDFFWSILHWRFSTFIKFTIAVKLSDLECFSEVNKVNKINKIDSILFKIAKTITFVLYILCFCSLLWLMWLIILYYIPGILDNEVIDLFYFLYLLYTDFFYIVWLLVFSFWFLWVLWVNNKY